MVSAAREGGDNDGTKEVVLLKEVMDELERLRENDRQSQNRMKQLVRDNDKLKDQLRVLESLLNCISDFTTKTPKSDEKESDQNMQLNNQQFTRTLIKLTCECAVINKKFKYLRRLMKINHRKLTETEKVAKVGMDKQKTTVADKTCQVALTGETVSVGTTTLQDGSDADQVYSDVLISDVFYLPTHPDLPDLRLFDLL